MPNVSVRAKPLAVAIAGVVLLTSMSAHAISKRDRAAVENLDARMQAAEQRYARALVATRNAEPDSQREADAALEDMEDVVDACMRQRGCNVVGMMSTFKRLLKGQVDAGASDMDEGVDAGAHVASADVPEAARAAALLAGGKNIERMVELNPAVQAGIRRWLTDMRPALMNSYENYQNMRHVMWPEFQRAGLPEALLFGIMAKESNGKVHVTSRTGAAGPMQFMPATGQRFGLGNDGSGFDTRFDARSSARASADYLNERLRQLDGNIELALAGYNGGEGRALRVHRQAGGRSFWDEAVFSEFPEETRDYVPMVIAAAWLFLHPKEYGISFPKVDARPVGLRLAQPISINQLTICLGNPGSRDGYSRVLRNLNPRYGLDQVLPTGTTLQANQRIAGLYERWCVDGPRADLARSLVSIDPTRALVRANAPVRTMAASAPVSMPVSATSRRYSVQAGETLTSIAAKFDCRLDDLARANGLGQSAKWVQPGQTLQLAGCRG